MRLSLATIAISLLATCASYTPPDDDFDKIDKPETGEKIPAGSTYTIKWRVPETAGKGPVTIQVLAGPKQDALQVVETVVKGLLNSDEKYDWVVNPKLGSAPFYGLSITLEENPIHYQYSKSFHIVGKAGNDTSQTGDDTTTKTTGSGETVTSTSTSTTGTGETKPTGGSETSAGHDGTTSHSSTGTSGPTSGTSAGPATQTQTGGAGATAGPLVAAGAYALAALLL